MELQYIIDEISLRKKYKKHDTISRNFASEFIHEIQLCKSATLPRKFRARMGGGGGVETTAVT